MGGEAGDERVNEACERVTARPHEHLDKAGSNLRGNRDRCRPSVRCCIQLLRAVVGCGASRREVVRVLLE
eukprot:scaffold279656_cov30-Tisochrysis_lutea.AAC.5